MSEICPLSVMGMDAQIKSIKGNPVLLLTISAMMSTMKNVLNNYWVINLEGSDLKSLFEHDYIKIKMIIWVSLPIIVNLNFIEGGYSSPFFVLQN